MKSEGIESGKSKPFVIADGLTYMENGAVTRVIIRRATGNVTAVADDTRELREKISPYDTLVQIVEGRMEILIDKTAYTLDTGYSIIIPAHAKSSIKGSPRYKMLMTVIKSGYEE